MNVLKKSDSDSDSPNLKNNNNNNNTKEFAREIEDTEAEEECFEY